MSAQTDIEIHIAAEVDFGNPDHLAAWAAIIRFLNERAIEINRLLEDPLFKDIKPYTF